MGEITSVDMTRSLLRQSFDSSLRISSPISNLRAAKSLKKDLVRDVVDEEMESSSRSARKSSLKVLDITIFFLIITGIIYFKLISQ